eukprot:GHVU01012945.1.p1 GENE.GHVU01012945.1~~GHVU01012945.1.p1  ORF type:complete len:511 (+),score=52.36 GHVU01012945.1:434-1966(+)
MKACYDIELLWKQYSTKYQGTFDEAFVKTIEADAAIVYQKYCKTVLEEGFIGPDPKKMTTFSYPGFETQASLNNIKPRSHAKVTTIKPTDSYSYDERAKERQGDPESGARLDDILSTVVGKTDSVSADQGTATAVQKEVVEAAQSRDHSAASTPGGGGHSTSPHPPATSSVGGTQAYLDQDQAEEPAFDPAAVGGMIDDLDYDIDISNSLTQGVSQGHTTSGGEWLDDYKNPQFPNLEETSDADEGKDDSTPPAPTDGRPSEELDPTLEDISEVIARQADVSYSESDAEAPTKPSSLEMLPSPGKQGQVGGEQTNQEQPTSDEAFSTVDGEGELLVYEGFFSDMFTTAKHTRSVHSEHDWEAILQGLGGYLLTLITQQCAAVNTVLEHTAFKDIPIHSKFQELIKLRDLIVDLERFKAKGYRGQSPDISSYCEELRSLPESGLSMAIPTEIEWIHINILKCSVTSPPEKNIAVQIRKFREMNALLWQEIYECSAKRPNKEANKAKLQANT